MWPNTDLLIALKDNLPKAEHFIHNYHKSSNSFKFIREHKQITDYFDESV